MAGLFNLDNPIWRFVGKFADLMLLNLLWVVCSIPIVTMGASTTAVYYVTLKLVRDEEGYIARSFFKSFKENFKQSTIIWLIMLVMTVVLVVDLRIYLSSGSLSTFNRVLSILFFALSIIFVLVSLYIFPIQSKFINPIKRTFINAFFMSIRHLPYSILMLVSNIGLLYIAIFLVPQITMVLIIFGFPLFAFVNSYCFVRIFDKYVPKEEKIKEDELSVLFADEDGAEPYTGNADIWATPPTGVTPIPGRDIPAKEIPGQKEEDK